MLNIGGGEVVLLVLLALLVLGPSRLPTYAALLAQNVRRLRDLAEGAKSQIRTEMGPAFDDVDWRQLDPRQYDPRRIVREALATPSDTPRAGSSGGPTVQHATAGSTAVGPGSAARPSAATVPAFDPARPTPFDLEAT
ncbi:Sec-independent protein translocase TatB [Ornithinimicrobium tianjinense]|uniref:Translocase n=1 Tax=Ornithinimicrobium tianjinense TaxID=1195761 RepID=A0A917BXA3_9MICO|nr:Sec-independent protein translocase TatB [Ornithinimicrobium tianjinense]GGF59702.1 translocase [Ornithinimicrobium tianjinense]